MKLLEFCQELENDIKAAYEEGVTVEHAERLAAKFLLGQTKVAAELQNSDLDARMRKSGLKAIKAAVFLGAMQGVDKKPSDKVLEATVDSSDDVLNEQKAFDEAEVYRNRLQSWYDVFHEGHIFMRGISKGRFE